MLQRTKQAPETSETSPESREKFWMSITSEEVYMVSLIFCFVHRDCGKEVYALAGEGEVELRCERCGVSKVYDLEDPNFRPDDRLGLLFRF
jgi:hypothetical protein